MLTGAYLILLALVTIPVRAQQPVPERVIDVTGSVEGAIEVQVQTFKQGGRPEVLRQSDVLIYPFGVYQPVLTCTVLRACIIELQAGETLISLVAGDDQRWLIDHTVTGHGGDTPLVIVKPTDHEITTNLVISTDRRVYHITLDSPPGRRKGASQNPLDRYTRHITFYYPAESVRRITQREDLMRRQQERLVTKAGPGRSLTDLDYNYGWHRRKGFPWEPVAVFDDGARVYLKLPKEATTYEQPLLVVEEGGEDQIVQYIVRDGFYIIDRLFRRARLVVSRTKRTGVLRRKRQVHAELYIVPLPR